jgi:hypothetical protein
MKKNIMLAASMMMLVAISGQAFARTAVTSEHHSGRQAADTFNAFDTTLATPAAAPIAHRYEGGPKSND